MGLIALISKVINMIIREVVFTNGMNFTLDWLVGKTDIIETHNK